jgi:hypothetical protein
MSDSDSDHSNLSLGASDKEEEPVVVQTRESRGVATPYKGGSGVPGTSIYTKPITTISPSGTFNVPAKQTVKIESDRSSEKESLALDSDDDKNKESEQPFVQKRRDSGLRKPANLGKILQDVNKAEPTIINNNYSININLDKRENFNIKITPPNRTVTETYNKKADNQPIRLMGSNTYNNQGVIEQPIDLRSSGMYGSFQRGENNDRPVDLRSSGTYGSFQRGENNDRPVDLRSSGMYSFPTKDISKELTPSYVEPERYSLRPPSSNRLKESIKFEEQEFDKGYEIYKNPKPGNSIYDKLAEGEEYYEEDEEGEVGPNEDYIEEDEYPEDNFETIGECDEENMDEVSELDNGDAADQSMYEMEFLKDALIESNKQYVKCQMQFEEKMKKCASRMVCFF